jgi:hypothetical protein
MPSWQCEKGCLGPDGTPKWHRKRGDCPKEPFYKGPPDAGKAGPGSGDAPAGSSHPPQPAPKPAGGLTFKDSKAEVVKGDASKKAAAAQIVDFIVDGEHTVLAWNLGLGGAWYIFAGIDLFVFGSDKHLPKNQFKLSDTATQVIIPGQPRNNYARAVTFLCKKAGATNIEQAHGMIDTLGFIEGFGGLIVVIAWHYKGLMNDPELKKKREEKRRLKEVRKRGAITVKGTDVTPAVPP